MTDYNDWSENALVYEYRRKRHNEGISTSSLLAHLLQLDDELKAAEVRLEALEFRPSTEPPSIESGEVIHLEAIVQVTYHRSKVAPSQDWYIDAISEAIDTEDILGWRAGDNA
jgi:hypothetical protein